MQKETTSLDQRRSASLGMVMALFFLAFGFIFLYGWYKEASFLVPRLFPITAFVVFAVIGWRAWRFFSQEYHKTGHLPLPKFVSAVCLPLFILSSVHIFDHLAQPFIWTKKVAVVEEVERVRIGRAARSRSRRTATEVTYRYEVDGNTYARKERMNTVRLHEANVWNASSSLATVGDDVSFVYHASGSLSFGSRIGTEMKGRPIVVRVHPLYPERVFAQQSVRFSFYLLAALSLFVWVRYGRKEKTYV